jgi:pSer/pThr/pTyr-binding forkhead associated (FHA) protein
MKYSIKFKISSPEASQIHELKLEEGKKFEIGRQGGESGLGLTLSDSSVSRRHCSLIVENGSLFLIDEGSTNGTSVAGTKIARHQARAGDTARMGIYTLEFIDVPGTTIASDTAGAELPLVPKPAARPSEAKPPAAEKKVRPGTRTESLTEKAVPFSTGQINWFKSLEQRKFNQQELLGLFKLAITNPKEFFATTDFSGDVKVSLVVIAAASLFSTLMTYFSFRSAPFIGAFMTSQMGPVYMIGQLVSSVVAAALFAWIFQMVRGFLGTNALFNNYLRFFAYVGFVSLPGYLLGMAFLPLMGLLGFALIVWAVYGFFVTFKPKTIPFIIVMISIWIAMAVSGTMWNKVRYGGFTGAGLMNFGKSGGEKAFNGKGGEELRQGATQFAQMLSNADPEKKRVMQEFQELLHAGFKAGETYAYVMAVSTNEGNKSGQMSIRVNEVTGPLAKVTVSGTYDGKPMEFDRDINHQDFLPVGDLVATSQKDIDEFNPAGFLSMLLVAQAPFDGLAIAMPLMLLSNGILIKTGQDTVVAGVAGKSFEGWPFEKRERNGGNSPILLGLRHNIQRFAVSKQIALPLLLSGQSAKLRAGYTIQLQSYSK